MRAGLMKTRIGFYRQTATQDATGSTALTYSGTAYYTGSFQRVRITGDENINADRLEEDATEIYRGRMPKSFAFDLTDKVLIGSTQYNLRDIDDSEKYFGNVILKVSLNK